MTQHILAYHGVRTGPAAGPTAGDLHADRFRRQCEAIAARGWQAVPLREAMSAAGKKPFVFTADDGYESVFTEMLPVCRRYGWRGSVFVASDLVGDAGGWDPGTFGRSRLLDWSGLRELVAAGWEVGSHGASHRALTDLPRRSALSELVESRERIERELGVPVESLSYPFGAVSAEVISLARKAGYRRAVTMRPGAASPGSNPLALPRWPVYRVDGPANLLARLEGPDWLRSIEAAKVSVMQQFSRGTRVVMAGRSGNRILD